MTFTSPSRKWTGPFFGLGTNGKVDLFCSPRGTPNEELISFFVHNGYWEGKFDAKTQEILIPADDQGNYERRPTQLLWVGDLPDGKKWDYNEAIDWIQDRVDGKVSVEEDLESQERLCEKCGSHLTLLWSGVRCDKCGWWFCL